MAVNEEERDRAVEEETVGGTSAPGESPEASPPEMHVVLVHPEIPGNTGNVGRTCLGAGARLHLIRPLGFSLDDRQVRRAGLDYWERVDPRVWPDWSRFESEFGDAERGWFFTSEAARPYWDVRFGRRPILVFGRESDGLPESLRRRYADRLLGIPMKDPTLRSLNLSNSVAVVLFEVLRQRAAEECP